MPDLVTLIKQAALDAVGNQKPTQEMLGTVESENPLTVRIEQKLLLGRNQLILTRTVSDYELEIETGIQTGSAGDPSHAHAIEGKKTVKILNGLKTGESVLLIRMQGGQKYIILDRVVNA